MTDSTEFRFADDPASRRPPVAEEAADDRSLRAEHERVLERALFMKGNRYDEWVFELQDGQLHLLDPAA